MSKIIYPFAAIPNQVLRGGHGAINVAVLAVLMSHGRSTASAKTLANEIGCDRKSVFSAINYWKESGPRYGIFLTTSENIGQATVIEIEITTCTENGTGTTGGCTENGTGGVPKTVHPPVPKTVHKEEPIKKNLEEDKREAILSPTPKQESEMFFSDQGRQSEVAELLVSRGVPQEAARAEIAKFVGYWTEPNSTGTKQRWQLQKTFEVKRRLVTWMQRAVARPAYRQESKTVKI